MGLSWLRVGLAFGVTLMGGALCWMSWRDFLAQTGAVRALALHRLGEDQEALARLLDAAGLAPGNADIQRQLSVTLGSLGLYRQNASVTQAAVRAGRRASALNPLDGRNDFALARAYLAAGQHEAAARSYRAALSKDPYNRGYLYYAGYLAETLNHRREAAALYRRAIRVLPEARVREALARVERP